MSKPNATAEINGTYFAIDSSHCLSPSALTALLQACPALQFVFVQHLPRAVSVWPSGHCHSATSAGAASRCHAFKHHFTLQTKVNSLKTSQFIISSAWPANVTEISFPFLCNMFLTESTQASKSLATMD